MKNTDAACSSPQNLPRLFDLEGQILKEFKGHGLYEICNEYRERDQVGLSHLLQEEEEGRGMNKNTKKNSIMESTYTEQMDGYNQ